MNYYSFLYQNRKFILTFYIFSLIAGIYTLWIIPRYENPPITAPGISIFIGYPGANPAEMEKLILDPIEDALSELSDIKKIQSICKADLVEIRIEFRHGVEIDKKYREVIDRINAIDYQLLRDIAYKWFFKWSVSDINIFQLAIIPEGNPEDIPETLLQDLKDDLASLKGVKKVSIYGLPEKKVYIDIDPAKLAQHNLSYPEIFGILASSNVALPAGNITASDRKISVYINTDISQVSILENLIIKSDGTHNLYLKDIASVYVRYEDDDYRTYFNGKKAYFIALSQAPGTNIFHVMRRVKTVIKQYREEFEPYYRFYPVFEQSATVGFRLNNFFLNLAEGLLLVGLVVFLLIHKRAALIILISIPLSCLIAVFFLKIAGYGLQQVSIAGLIITLGMLVDNSIVVTENIFRHLENKVTLSQAISSGTLEVLWPVFSATGTTILAFLPLLMLNSIVGDFIFTLPLTVILALAASYIISISLTPLLVYYLFAGRAVSHQQKFLFLMDKFRSDILLPSLKKMLHHPGKIVLVALVLFALSLSLVPLIGISFFPKSEIPQIMIQVNLPKGSSIDKTEQVVRKVEEILSREPSVQHFATNVGRGNPRIYYNHFVPLSDPSMAEILCQLNTFNPKAIGEISQRLRNKFNRFSEAKIKVIEFMQGPPQEAPLEIRITHSDLRKLEEITMRTDSLLRKIPEVINIEAPLLEKRLQLTGKVERDKAGRLGVSMLDLSRSIRTALSGIEVGRIRKTNGEEYPIILRAHAQNQNRLSDLSYIYIPAISGKTIPLPELVRFSIESQPVEIRHFNFKRISLIRGDILRGYSSIKVIRKIEKILNQKTGNEFRYISFGGDKENQAEAFRGLTQASFLALLLVLLLLVIQFKSYFQPFIILSTIPLATIGSFLSLFLTGNFFSFMAFIGYASLIGIVVNNAIVLVDFINQYLHKHQEKVDEAILEAVKSRFRPILSTTITTILGLLPLTIFGGTLWAPLGWVIIGGLSVSAGFTLFIVPALYKIFYKIEKKFE